LPSIALWIVVLLGLVEKVNNNQTSDFQYINAWQGSSMKLIATDVTLIYLFLVLQAVFHC
jgi:hypothetical protein